MAEASRSAGSCSRTATWPDETALEIPRHCTVAIADGVNNYDGLGFFPDFLLGNGREQLRRFAAG
jgi:hypothetical protein